MHSHKNSDNSINYYVYDYIDKLKESSTEHQDLSESLLDKLKKLFESIDDEVTDEILDEAERINQFLNYVTSLSNNEFQEIKNSSSNAIEKANKRKEKIEDLQQEIYLLKEDLSSAEKEKERIIKRFDSMTDEIVKVYEENKNLQRKISIDMEEKIKENNINNENKLYLKEIENLKNGNEILKRKIFFYEDEFGKTKKENENLVGVNQKLSKENKNLNNLLMSKIKNEADLKKDNQKLQDRVDVLVQENEQFIIEVEQAKMERDDYQEKCNELDEKINNLQKIYKNFDSKNKGYKLCLLENDSSDEAKNGKNDKNEEDDDSEKKDKCDKSENESDNENDNKEKERIINNKNVNLTKISSFSKGLNILRLNLNGNGSGNNGNIGNSHGVENKELKNEKKIVKFDKSKSTNLNKKNNNNNINNNSGSDKDNNRKDNDKEIDYYEEDNLSYRNKNYKSNNNIRENVKSKKIYKEQEKEKNKDKDKDRSNDFTYLNDLLGDEEEVDSSNLIKNHIPYADSVCHTLPTESDTKMKLDKMSNINPQNSKIFESQKSLGKILIERTKKNISISQEYSFTIQNESRNSKRIRSLIRKNTKKIAQRNRHLKELKKEVDNKKSSDTYSKREFDFEIDTDEKSIEKNDKIDVKEKKEINDKKDENEDIDDYSNYETSLYLYSYCF